MNKELNNNQVVHSASLALKEIQDRTIGLFKPYYSNKLELVIEKEGDSLRTIYFLGLGGFHDTHIQEDKGIYKPFGEGRTLTDMLNNPIELKYIEFCDSFNNK